MLNICALPPALKTHVGEGMGRGGGNGQYNEKKEDYGVYKIEK